MTAFEGDQGTKLEDDQPPIEGARTTPNDLRRLPNGSLLQNPHSRAVLEPKNGEGCQLSERGNLHPKHDENGHYCGPWVAPSAEIVPPDDPDDYCAIGADDG